MHDRVGCYFCGGWREVDPGTGEIGTCDTCLDEPQSTSQVGLGLVAIGIVVLLLGVTGFLFRVR